MTDDAPFGYTKAGTPRKRRARAGEGPPEHRPTAKSRDKVLALAGYGIPQEDIALVMEVSPPTLRKHYRLELDTGHVHANAKVVESLWNNAAKKGDTTACIWWTKSQMGWSEKIKHEGTITHKHEHSLVDDFTSRIIGIAARLAEGERAQKANGSAGPPASN